MLTAWRGEDNEELDVLGDTVEEDSAIDGVTEYKKVY